MALSIGIVGLPNVGKSTLFNALLKRQVALAANYPFATIDPNIGVVDVPDDNLKKMAEVVVKDYAKPGDSKIIPEKIVPATVNFYDIAGLVKGASQGEGLGNKFLSHIREVDAIVHLVRDFSDNTVVREGSTDPLNDIAVINTELILADLNTLETRIEKHQANLKKERSKENLRKQELYELLLEVLNSGELASSLELSDDDQLLVKDTHLLTLKPMIMVYNTDEEKLKSYENATNSGTAIYLCAKIESELSGLTDEDQQLYMQDLGIKSSGLSKVITKGYEILKLQSFYTAGPKEVRSWTIEQGTKAPQAAGKIHTDFEKGFIKAKVISVDDLMSVGSFKIAKDKGLIRLEGKDYVMQVGDIVEFMFNN